MSGILTFELFLDLFPVVVVPDFRIKFPLQLLEEGRYVFLGKGLGKVTTDIELYCLPGIIKFIVPGNEADAYRGVVSPNDASQFDTVSIRHFYVRQDNLGSMIFYEVQSIVAIARSADDQETTFGRYLG